MKFSDRIGATSPNSVIQLNEINQELRNSLWNYFLEHIWKFLLSNQSEDMRWKNIHFITTDVYKFLKIPIDEVPTKSHLCQEFFKKRFLQSEWYLPYNILQHTIKILDSAIDDSSREELNRILEIEGSGYRLIQNKIVPISDEIEVSEIEAVFASQDEYGLLHIKAAIDAISNKENPDYRNCIKESISAVEAVARKITNKNTLGKALNNLEKKGVNINPNFKTSMEKLYTYTNDDKTGIRHSLMDRKSPPKYEEAKYMLVVCCAFVNLLKGWNLKSSQKAKDD